MRVANTLAASTLSSPLRAISPELRRAAPDRPQQCTTPEPAPDRPSGMAAYPSDRTLTATVRHAAFVQHQRIAAGRPHAGSIGPVGSHLRCAPARPAAPSSKIPAVRGRCGISGIGHHQHVVRRLDHRGEQFPPGDAEAAFHSAARRRPAAVTRDRDEPCRPGPEKLPLIIFALLDDEVGDVAASPGATDASAFGNVAASPPRACMLNASAVAGQPCPNASFISQGMTEEIETHPAERRVDRQCFRKPSSPHAR